MDMRSKKVYRYIVPINLMPSIGISWIFDEFAQLVLKEKRAYKKWQPQGPSVADTLIASSHLILFFLPQRTQLAVNLKQQAPSSQLRNFRNTVDRELFQSRVSYE